MCNACDFVGGPFEYMEFELGLVVVVADVCGLDEFGFRIVCREQGFWILFMDGQQNGPVDGDELFVFVVG